MKLGMIIRPQPEEFDHLKKLGLDFAELDFNPTEYFGMTIEQINEIVPQLKEASERTGIEVGAVGRWASHLLNEDARSMKRNGTMSGNHQSRQGIGRQTLSLQRRIRSPADLLQKHHGCNCSTQNDCC